MLGIDIKVPTKANLQFLCQGEISPPRPSFALLFTHHVSLFTHHI